MSGSFSLSGREWMPGTKNPMASKYSTPASPTSVTSRSLVPAPSASKGALSRQRWPVIALPRMMAVVPGGTNSCRMRQNSSNRSACPEGQPDHVLALLFFGEASLHLVVVFRFDHGCRGYKNRAAALTPASVSAEMAETASNSGRSCQPRPVLSCSAKSGSAMPRTLTVLAPIRRGEEDALRALLRPIGDDIRGKRLGQEVDRPRIEFPRSQRIHFARFAILADPDRGSDCDACSIRPTTMATWRVTSPS